MQTLTSRKRICVGDCSTSGTSVTCVPCLCKLEGFDLVVVSLHLVYRDMLYLCKLAPRQLR